ncbi:MAG: hypothetical protein ABID54_02360 [Pseudomonadota bacterium]
MKLFWRATSASLVLFLPLYASGYIPSANFLIKMMLAANQAVQNVRVEQIATTFNEDSGSEDLQVSEVLYLRIPDSYRLDIESRDGKKTIIYKRGELLTTEAGRVTSESPDEMSISKDLFIRRSVDDVIQLLRSRKVDTERMGLGRFDGKIAFIIGATERETESPQLWIEKENFLPLRFIVRAEKKVAVANVEIRYLDYKQVDGKYWYPFTIEFYHDNTLAVRYQAQRVVINTNVPDNLFDIVKIRKESVKTTHGR